MSTYEGKQASWNWYIHNGSKSPPLAHPALIPLFHQCSCTLCFHLLSDKAYFTTHSWRFTSNLSKACARHLLSACLCSLQSPVHTALLQPCNSVFQYFLALHFCHVQVASQLPARISQPVFYANTTFTFSIIWNQNQCLNFSKKKKAM